MKNSWRKRLDRLDNRLESLLDEAREYPESLHNRPPAEGKWSAIQNMHHLMLAEELSQKYLEKKLGFDPELPSGGFGERWRRLLLAGFFLLPFKFKAPQGVDTAAMPDDARLEEVAQRWRSNRESLRKYLEQLPEKWHDKLAYRHPFAGRLTIDGMLGFFEGHFDRHRKQIRKALNDG